MRWHRTDRLSLGFGLFFFAISALWVVIEVAQMGAGAVVWSAVCGLFVCALLGIAGIAAAARRRHTEDHHP
jgi:apolipoprotein N-acyltransferase